MNQLFLQNIDAAPLSDLAFTPEFKQWITVLIDSLNETLLSIQDSFNFLTAPNYTAAEIATMFANGDFTNGIFLYDTTNNVYVGMISNALVKFTTTAYP